MLEIATSHNEEKEQIVEAYTRTQKQLWSEQWPGFSRKIISNINDTYFPSCAFLGNVFQLYPLKADHIA